MCDTRKLIDAITKQTEALTRMAESNEALTKALLEQAMQEDAIEDKSDTYLDGSSVHPLPLITKRF